MKKPLRALLINPYIYDFACYDLFSKPIGLLQIAAALGKLGFEVELIDCMDRAKLRPRDSGCGNYYCETAVKPEVFKDIPRAYKRYGMTPQALKKAIGKIKEPDVVLVTSGMTYWYKGVFEAIDIARDRFKRTPIALGGIYATLCYDHALRSSGADLVFKGTDIKKAVKAVHKLTGSTAKTFPEVGLPPAYELYDKLHYVTLRTSSGCPFKCSYCGWYLLNDKICRKGHREVCSEIGYFYSKLKVRNFAFYDEALFYEPEEHVMKILAGLIRMKIRANFYTPNGLHARFLNRELAYLLKKCNFIQPRLGFESSSLDRQKRTGGKVYNAEVSEAVRLLSGAGYRGRDIGIYILMGLPDQTVEEMEKTIRFAHSLGVRVYIEEYSPIPGTPDYNRSGLRVDCDPVLHNNSAFPLYDGKRYAEYQKLKQLNHKLNRGLN